MPVPVPVVAAAGEDVPVSDLGITVAVAAARDVPIGAARMVGMRRDATAQRLRSCIFALDGL